MLALEFLTSFMFVQCGFWVRSCFRHNWLGWASVWALVYKLGNAWICIVSHTRHSRAKPCFRHFWLGFLSRLILCSTTTTAKNPYNYNLQKKEASLVACLMLITRYYHCSQANNYQQWRDKFYIDRFRSFDSVGSKFAILHWLTKPVTVNKRSHYRAACEIAF